MNNLPLQPLVWNDGGNNYGDLEAHSPSHYYVITEEDEKQKVMYGKHYHISKEATGFATVDEAKQWAWNHYNEKMQPYVKPMPTWVDVNEREPNEKGDYLIRDYQGRVAMGKYDKGFYMESGGEKWGCVQFWMPIPEFSTMQNNKGE